MGSPLAQLYTTCRLSHDADEVEAVWVGGMVRAESMRVITEGVLKGRDFLLKMKPKLP